MIVQADPASLFTSGERWEYKSGINSKPKVITVVSVGYHEHNTMLVHAEYGRGNFFDFYLPIIGPQLVCAEDGYLSFRIFGDDVASLRRINGAPLGT